MAGVNVSEAMIQLSRLPNPVATGDAVVITRRGRPVVRLVRNAPRRERQFGTMQGASRFRTHPSNRYQTPR